MNSPWVLILEGIAHLGSQIRGSLFQIFNEMIEKNDVLDSFQDLYYMNV